MASARQIARAAGYYVREGAYRNTTDDRLGCWYFGHDSDNGFRPFGSGHPSQKAAWEAAVEHAQQTGRVCGAGRAGIDISAKIGPPDSGREWLMYSYDRPAYMLWNAIAGALHKRGWSEAQIRDWLQSKGPRWALDGDLGDSIQAIGEAYAHGMESV